MAKGKVERRKDKATLAREAARKLVEKRAALKKLQAKESLSPDDVEAVRCLVDQIRSFKGVIQDLGFDPKLAASAAAALMIKESLEVKTKGKNIKIRRRKGGVGMYGLGSTIKSWR